MHPLRYTHIVVIEHSWAVTRRTSTRRSELLSLPQSFVIVDVAAVEWTVCIHIRTATIHSMSLNSTWIPTTVLKHNLSAIVCTYYHFSLPATLIVKTGTNRNNRITLPTKTPPLANYLSASTTRSSAQCSPRHTLQMLTHVLYINSSIRWPTPSLYTRALPDTASMLKKVIPDSRHCVYVYVLSINKTKSDICT